MSPCGPWPLSSRDISHCVLRLEVTLLCSTTRREHYTPLSTVRDLSSGDPQVGSDWRVCNIDISNIGSQVFVWEADTSTSWTLGLTVSGNSDTNNQSGQAEL